MELSLPSCVWGYHIYKWTWTPTIGEVLTCECETGNTEDRYAMTVLGWGPVVSHIPRKILVLCFLFLCRRDPMECTITGVWSSSWGYIIVRSFIATDFARRASLCLFLSMHYPSICSLYLLLGEGRNFPWQRGRKVIKQCHGACLCQCAQVTKDIRITFSKPW